MAKIRRVVLDVLKPHDPSMPKFTTDVAAIVGVAAVNASLIEMDREVQNVKLAVDGADIDVEELEAGIADLGATVHSIDRVAAGDHIIAEPRPTHEQPVPDVDR